LNKLLTILFFLCIQLLSFGQQQGILITGNVVDSASLEPIANVSVKVNGTSIASQSNVKGNFSIRAASIPAVLSFTHLNYEAFSLEVATATGAAINIKLKKKITLLPVVDITTNKPQTLAQGQPLFIKDYDFYDDKIIVLAYKDRMLTRPLLCLLNLDGDTLCTVRLMNPGKLFRDCFGNDHLLTGSTAWQLFVDSNLVDLIYPSDIEEFNERLKPVLAEKNNKFFYRQYYYNNQFLQYFYYDKSARKTEELKVISDEKKLFMMRDAQRIVAASDDPETQARFENLAFYQPLCAPLVKINDTICIFNYVDSVIEFYSDSCKLVKEIPITFHNNFNWKRGIYVDDAKGKVYALFRKNGISTLKEVSLQSGELQNSVIIPEFPFIENIKVYDDHIYFLYTEHHDLSEFKRLYKMKI
jgi:hypothetical protein